MPYYAMDKAINWLAAMAIVAVLAWAGGSVVASAAVPPMGSPLTDPARFAVAFLGVASDTSTTATYERGRLVVTLQWPCESIDDEALAVVYVVLRRFPRVREIVITGAKPNGWPIASITFERSKTGNAVWVTY